MRSPNTRSLLVELVRPNHSYLHRPHIAACFLTYHSFSTLTDLYHSNRLVATLVQEIREDLVEFERQVEEDTASAMKQAKSTGTDKKREKELMKLVLAATA